MLTSWCFGKIHSNNSPWCGDTVIICESYNMPEDISKMDSIFVLNVNIQSQHSNHFCMTYFNSKQKRQTAIIIMQFLPISQVEAKTSPEEDWYFIRILHLHVEESATLKMGLLMCAPTDEGGQVVFSRLTFRDNPGYEH